METTAVRYRAYLTKEQETNIPQLLGNCRYIYNWARQIKYEEYQKWIGLGKQKDFSWLTYKDLSKLMSKHRNETPWLAEVSQHNTLQQALRHLFSSYQRFFKGHSQYPQAKKKGKRDSKAHFSNDQVRPYHIEKLNARWLQVNVPNIGLVTLRHHKDLPEGKLLRTVLSKDGSEFYVSFFFQVEDGYYLRNSNKERKPKCGIDIGVVNPITVYYLNSKGEEKAVIKGRRTKRHLHRLEKQRKRVQRSVSRKFIAYRKRCKVNKKTGEISNPSKSNLNKGLEQLRSLFQKERRAREHWAQNESKKLAEHFDIIKFEDLSVSKMTRSAKGTKENPGKNVKQKSGLNREMLRLSLGRLIQLTEYKASLYGGQVQLVDPRFTSQRCSCCGYTDRGNRKSQAKFVCQSCGFSWHADMNAAKNIYKRKYLPG